MSTLSVSNITDGTDTVETGYVVNGSAKAWANCGGDAAFLDSFNLSSGTDNGTGDYTYPLISAFDAYTYSQPCSTRVGRGSTRIAMMSSSRGTSSVLAVHTENEASTLVDVGHVVTAFGDLA